MDISEKTPFLHVGLAAFFVLVMLAGCETAPEQTWQEMMATRVAANDFEKNYKGFAVPYEKGDLDYTIRIKENLTEEQNRTLLQDKTLADAKLIQNVFDFYLDGTPLELSGEAFPPDGSEETGTINGDPFPEWLLVRNTYLKPLYGNAQRGSPEDMFAFAEKLAQVENRSHPDLDPLAFYWFRKAADAGHGKAAMKTAIRYRDGDGVVQNEENYQRYLEKAMLSGNMDAFNEKAWNLATTRGASPDELRQAREYAEKAVLSSRANHYLDTLATLEARLGNWERAVELESEVINNYQKQYGLGGSLSMPRKEWDLYEAYLERLEAFKKQEIPNKFYL